MANNYFMATGHVWARALKRICGWTPSAILTVSGRMVSNTNWVRIMGRITNDLFDVTEFAHHCPR